MPLPAGDEMHHSAPRHLPHTYLLLPGLLTPCIPSIQVRLHHSSVTSLPHIVAKTFNHVLRSVMGCLSQAVRPPVRLSSHLLAHSSVNISAISMNSHHKMRCASFMGIGDRPSPIWTPDSSFLSLLFSGYPELVSKMLLPPLPPFFPC